MATRKHTRAPVAPTTTKPATPEAAQARALQIVQEAERRMLEAEQSLRPLAPLPDPDGSARRAARVLAQLAAGITVTMPAVLHDKAASTLIADAFDAEALAVAVARAWPRNAAGQAAQAMAPLMRELVQVLDRIDWPETVAEAPAKIAQLNGLTLQQADAVLSQVVVIVHALEEQILHYEAEMPVAAMLLTMTRMVGTLVDSLSNSPLNGDVHEWTFGSPRTSSGSRLQPRCFRPVMAASGA